VRSTPSSPEYSLPWRVSRATLGVLIGLVLAFFALEGAFRFLLFSDTEFAERQGARLRNPHLFADHDSDSDYFKLKQIWSGGNPSKKFVRRNPKLGWLPELVKMPGYGHVAGDRGGERRPFLFYGDSFVACVTPKRDCWQGLLANTPFGEELFTLNYGCSAYGLDQINLLFEESIDQWLPQKPIVAIGILVDNDLDRTVFDYRGCPKPLYRFEDGELAVDYPGGTDYEKWLEENPPSISSYVVRYLSHARSVLPASFAPPRSNDPPVVERKKKLSAAILESLQHELESRELDYFFVLFYGPRTWEFKRPTGWREKFTVNTLDALGIPWVSSRRAMQESAKRFESETGELASERYFVQHGVNFEGHFTREGNLAALPAIMRGLTGQYDGLVKTRATNIATPLPLE